MFKIIDCKKTIDGILKEAPDRTRDVLSRRFGVGKNERQETLEGIGKDYGITRERVRQIEDRGLKNLKDSPSFLKLQKSFLETKQFIDKSGGLKREDVLEAALVSQPKYRHYLLFLLKIGSEFFYMPESSLFYSLWTTKKEAIDIANRVNNFFTSLMEKEKRLLKEEEVLEIGRKQIPRILKIKLPENHLLSYIEATKKIEENPFGEYGLSHWPEVNPKGVRDKAYLILKKKKESFHFQELAEIIEKELQKPVHANTLHNELIKNNEFILIGRGTYGLREWGYKDGTVKDIIEEILKEKNKLSKEKILDEVKKQRKVKETTIILNLQFFKKTEDGKYTL